MEPSSPLAVETTTTTTTKTQRERERENKRATDTLPHYGDKPRERKTWEMKKKNKKKKKEAGTVILRVV
jgi:hypothetical protein